ncbi:MAG: hypothetical protein J5J06_13475 [Phycisphaerae bacterium]|nr:hypothetical protein [Phycisphaerae bacterium]
MLRRLLTVGALVTVMSTGAWAQERAADDERQPRPRVLTARCLHRMGHATERTSRNMRMVTNRCVVQIKQLIHDGQTDEAAAAAAACTEAVTDLSGRGTERIDEIATKCTDLLSSLEEEVADLIGVIERATERAKTIIASHLARSLERINGALES